MCFQLDTSELNRNSNILYSKDDIKWDTYSLRGIVILKEASQKLCKFLRHSIMSSETMKSIPSINVAFHFRNTEHLPYRWKGESGIKICSSRDIARIPGNEHASNFEILKKIRMSLIRIIRNSWDLWDKLRGRTVLKIYLKTMPTDRRRSNGKV